MQKIFVEHPYEFVPPSRSEFVGRYFFRWWLPGKLKRDYGLERPTIVGAARFRESQRAGHAILLAPNHCRPSDPMVMGSFCAQLVQPCYILASWHLFMEGWLQRWMMRQVGAFSVHREIVDREALRTASQLLAEAQRPLIVFPEGIISRTNDRLGVLQEGTAFIARSAAKQLAKAQATRHVVIHPIGLRYRYAGDLATTAVPILDAVERQIGWQPQPPLAMLERIRKLGEALLAIKEVEYLGHAATGELHLRRIALMEAVLAPLEAHYRLAKGELSPLERIKRVRTAAYTPLMGREIPETERTLRWRHLADTYFAQQLDSYPEGYLEGEVPPERILETIERFEEDLTDEATIHRPMEVTITVGEAIDVPADAANDVLMRSLRSGMERCLGITSASGA